MNNEFNNNQNPINTTEQYNNLNNISTLENVV